MKPSRILRALLEVERKFCSLAVEDLVANTGQPPFKIVHACAWRTIHDVYYDDPSRSLIKAGIWVRQRNGFWEAKVKRGGDFIAVPFRSIRQSRVTRQFDMTKFDPCHDVHHQVTPADELNEMVQ